MDGRRFHRRLKISGDRIPLVADATVDDARAYIGISPVLHGFLPASQSARSAFRHECADDRFTIGRPTPAPSSLPVGSARGRPVPASPIAHKRASASAAPDDRFRAPGDPRLASAWATLHSCRAGAREQDSGGLAPTGSSRRTAGLRSRASGLGRATLNQAQATCVLRVLAWLPEGPQQVRGRCPLAIG